MINIKRLMWVCLMCAFLALASWLLVAGGCKILMKAFYPVKYEDVITKASKTYNVEKELIYAIIKCESDFDQNAHSHADAIGLMQITPDTFNWLRMNLHEKCVSSDMLKDPETNIMYGTLLISLLRRKYHNDDIVLCAYNAGETPVKRWLLDKKISSDGFNLQNIPYKETRNYVKKVKFAKKIYKKLYFNE